MAVSIDIMRPSVLSLIYNHVRFGKAYIFVFIQKIANFEISISIINAFLL